MIRPILALDRLSFPEGEGRVGYRHGDDWADLERMDYLELIARVMSPIPDKGRNGGKTRGLLVLGPVLDLEVGRLLRGQGLDEEVGGLEVGQDGDGEIDGQPPDLEFLTFVPGWDIPLL